MGLNIMRLRMTLNDNILTDIYILEDIHMNYYSLHSTLRACVLLFVVY